MHRTRLLPALVIALASTSCGGSEPLAGSAPSGIGSTTIATVQPAPTTVAASTTSTLAPATTTTTTITPTTTTTTTTTTTIAPTTTTTAPPPPTTIAVPPYTDYVEVADDSDLISVVVPVEWVDTDGRMWESSLATGSYDLIGPGLTATPDIDRFVGGWNTPGVFIGASAMISLDVEEMLNSYDFTDGCEYEGRFDYDDGAYTGLYDLYSRCGGTETYLYQIVAEPASQTWIASLQILLVTSADEAAFEQIINSWTVEELAG